MHGLWRIVVPHVRQGVHTNPWEQVMDRHQIVRRMWTVCSNVEWNRPPPPSLPAPSNALRRLPLSPGSRHLPACAGGRGRCVCGGRGGGQVTAMRQDPTNGLLWERQGSVVGTLLPSCSSPLLLLPGNLSLPQGGAMQTCPVNEYKTKTLTNRWVTEVKCVGFLSCSSSPSLPPPPPNSNPNPPLFIFFFFTAFGFTSANLGTIQPREKGRRKKTKRCGKVWELFCPSFIPSWVVSMGLTLSVPAPLHLWRVEF